MSTDPGLRAAFLATAYGTARERFHLRGVRGPPCPLFGPGQRWAILTAHNPHAAPQRADLNARAQGRLEARLRGRPVVRGVNGEGDWAEASLIVPGMPLGAALRLGREFAQVAVLCGCGQRAALVWCASGQVERFWTVQVERFWTVQTEDRPT